MLHAPAFLSGLSDTEWSFVRERAVETLHPDQAQMRKLLQAAIHDLRKGVDAAQRALRERCGLPADGEGHWPGTKCPSRPMPAVFDVREVLNKGGKAVLAHYANRVATMVPRRWWTRFIPRDDIALGPLHAAYLLVVVTPPSAASEDGMRAAFDAAIRLWD